MQPHASSSFRWVAGRPHGCLRQIGTIHIRDDNSVSSRIDAEAVAEAVRDRAVLLELEALQGRDSATGRLAGDGLDVARGLPRLEAEATGVMHELDRIADGWGWRRWRAWWRWW